MSLIEVADSLRRMSVLTETPEQLSSHTEYLLIYVLKMAYIGKIQFFRTKWSIILHFSLQPFSLQNIPGLDAGLDGKI